MNTKWPDSLAASPIHLALPLSYVAMSDVLACCAKRPPR